MNLQVTGLPQQQGRVLLGMANGEPMKTTARKLGVKPATVNTCRKAIFHKLHARNAPNAIARAFAIGYLRYIGCILCVLSTLLSLVPTIDNDAVLRLGRNRLRNRSRSSLHFDYTPPLTPDLDLNSPHQLAWDDGLYVEYLA
ncbi:MAG: helix-turn-helix transcriptional regulator [Pseudohongiellaceae bacterium]|nr:helix-turn-helix transcriptional regulator [Pseudohongiellaceae bacterium]